MFSISGHSQVTAQQNSGNHSNGTPSRCSANGIIDNAAKNILFTAGASALGGALAGSIVPGLGTGTGAAAGAITGSVTGAANSARQSLSTCTKRKK